MTMSSAYQVTLLENFSRRMFGTLLDTQNVEVPGDKSFLLHLLCVLQFFVQKFVNYCTESFSQLLLLKCSMNKLDGKLVTIRSIFDRAMIIITYFVR